MTTVFLRHAAIALGLTLLAACGGGGGGSGTQQVFAPDEITDGVYAQLSDRSAGGQAGMAYVVLEGQTRRDTDGVSVDYTTGDITGGLLNGTDLDSALYTNPANGEFSRIVAISNGSVFGIVGLDVMSGDLPTAGTVTNYNEGWVGMTAIFEEDVLVLTGDAEFTATWANGDIDGRFINLSGTNADSATVTNVGTIVLTNGSIDTDNFAFASSSISGTGVFAGLGGSGASSNTGGTFFGPAADELGGVVVIDDPNDDMQVLGAFQTD